MSDAQNGQVDVAAAKDAVEEAMKAFDRLLQMPPENSARFGLMLAEVKDALTDAWDELGGLEMMGE